MPHLRRLIVALALLIGPVPLTTASAAAAPIDGSSCTQQVRAIDVSQWNQVDWPTVARSGISGAWIKSTQGFWTSPTWGDQKAGAANAGLPWGGYSYLVPSGSDNAVADAQYFVQSGGASGSLTPMADIESSQLDPQGTALWVAYWLAAVTALDGGRRPLLYTGAYFDFSDELSAVFSGNTALWISAYPAGYTPVSSNCFLPQPNTLGWPGWSIWQATSSAQISGVAAGVDLDFITPALWASMTGATVQPPTTGVNTYPAATYGPGSSGSAVIKIQQLLQSVGLYRGQIDGVYGPGTQYGVALWQARLGFSAAQVDGIWGPGTQAATDNLFAYLNAQPKSPAPTPAAPNAALLHFMAHCRTKILHRSAMGPCVAFAQELLQRRGYPLAADGHFGRKTAMAVRAFRHLHHQAPRPVINARTWKELLR